MIKYSFKKSFRITKKLEFKEIFDNRKKTSGKYIFFYYKFNAENPKIGFIISKKKRNSVERNKLKRKLREIFRLNQYNLKNVSLIVGIKNGITDVKYDNLERDFLYCLRRIKCLKS